MLVVWIKCWCGVDIIISCPEGDLVILVIYLFRMFCTALLCLLERETLHSQLPSLKRETKQYPQAGNPVDNKKHDMILLVSFPL